MHIELNRTFRELLSKESLDDGRSLYPGNATLKMSELLNEMRVVVLSEGGSGKTQEFREAARQLRKQDKPAFFLRLEHIVVDFESAFLEGSLDELKKWLESGEPGWLLLDSIDESRLRSPKDFESAINKVAREISGAKQRTHLMLTGRAAAWRPKTDLELCVSLFPVINESMPGGEDASLAQTSKRGKPEIFPFKVVTLENLTPEQVQEFARRKGVVDTKAFLDDIERADGWSFTARPQDLIELTEYWQDKLAIGSRLELMQNSIKRRLQEVDPDRLDVELLPYEKAKEGAELIAGALVLTQTQNIRVPDQRSVKQGLNVLELFQNWPHTDVSALLRRSLFENDVYGTVRFHHRSVKEYLAAQWFLKLLRQEVSRRKVEALFFQEQYGLEVVVPSMRPLLPWLAMEDDRILARVRRVAPEIVFEGGDPVQLPAITRREILEQVCEQLASGSSRRSMADFSAIQRFAARDLASTLRKLVKKYADDDEIVSFLMRMVWQGRLAEALPEAMNVARSVTAGQYARIAAFRAIAVVGQAEDMASIREGFAQESAELNRKCMADLVSHITEPTAETLKWLLACIPKLAKFNEYDSTGLSEEVGAFFERADVELVASAIDRLHALLVKLPIIERTFCEISARNQWLREAAGVAVHRLISARHPAALKRSSLAVLHMLPIAAHYIGAYDVKKLGLAELVKQWPALNWALFWHVVDRERQAKAAKGVRVVDAWMALASGTYVTFDGDDFEGAVQAIAERPLADDKEVALTLAYHLYLRTDSQPSRAAKLKAAVKPEKSLKARLTGLMKPQKKDAAWKRMERENERWQRRATAQRERIEKLRLEAPAKLEAQLPTLRNPGFKNKSAVSQAQYYLFNRMRELEEDKGSHWTNGNWRALEAEFGTKTPQAFRDGMVNFWRSHSPKLASQGAAQNSTPLADLFGLAGVTIEAAEDPSLFRRLTPAEAAIAFRYGMRELNGFPVWFPALFASHADVVKKMALAEVRFELTGDKEDAPSHYIISTISRVGDWLWDSIAPDIVKLLRTQPPKSIHRLEHLVDIVLASRLPDATLSALAAEKMAADGDPKQLAMWAAVWTGVDPTPAIDAVEAHLAGLDGQKKRTVFTMHYVTYLIGGRHGSSRTRNAYRTPAVLKRLYILVHEHIRLREDVNRVNHGVYSPGLRDDAQDGRERLVTILTEIPGREAFLALWDIAQRHPEPNARPWFKLRARTKAEADSERPVWSAEQVCQFNREYERTPANHRELFDLAVLRLEDLKHEQEDGNFSIANVMINVDQETELRNLIGVWCAKQAQGRYVIAQENELPDAKRPDLWWNGSKFDGPVPTELKIADNWVGPKLFERLENQLAGDYLRDKASVRGIYLLVWRGVQQRWMLPGKSKKWVNFSELLAALQNHWTAVSDLHTDVEEVKVIGIDLTKRASAPAKARKPAARKTTTKTTTATKGLPVTATSRSAATGAKKTPAGNPATPKLRPTKKTSSK